MNLKWTFFSAALSVLVFLTACSRSTYQACRTKNDDLVTLDPGQSKAFFVNYEKKCNASGIKLEPTKIYRFSDFSVVSPLIDGSIDSDRRTGQPLGLKGWNTFQLSWFTWPGLIVGGWFRPLPSADWYELIGKVGDGAFFSLADQYMKEYSPKQEGELLALANDFPWFGRYENNQGRVRLTAECVRLRTDGGSGGK